jgi:hypothetical protein
MGKSGVHTRIGVIEFQFIKGNDIEVCQTKHGKTQNNTYRAASHAVFIMSNPAGHLCKHCVHEWKVLWESLIDYAD